jgi:hypothetical protein
MPTTHNHFPRTYTNTTTKAAPPKTHFAFPVIIGTPPVLALALALLLVTLPCVTVAPAPVPLVFVTNPELDFPPVVLDAAAPPALVLGAVGAAFVFDGAAVTSVASGPSVITTGMYEKSVPVKVSVLMPGKLASVPVKDSTQTAEEASSEQSK